jgi:hypothetical protein
MTSLQLLQQGGGADKCRACESKREAVNPGSECARSFAS